MIGTLSAHALLFLLSPVPSAAQDAHYWTLNYGPRGSLLSGSVVGSVDDVSGRFHNPGALGLEPPVPFPAPEPYTPPER